MRCRDCIYFDRMDHRDAEGREEFRGDHYCYYWHLHVSRDAKACEDFADSWRGEIC